MDALEKVLDAADRAASKALADDLDDDGLLLRRHPPDKNNNKKEEDDTEATRDSFFASVAPHKSKLRQVNREAVARVHAAMAELETEGYLSAGEPDAAAALYHCASAAAKGSAVAAHALARWHADLPAGALCPRFSDLKYAYPAKAGPLLVLAATRGDPAAAYAAADAFLCPRYGLPLDSKKARRLLAFALLHASKRDDDSLPFIRAAKAGDLVAGDYNARGFPQYATILRVHEDDGTLDLRYDDDDVEERRVPWSRVSPRRRPQERIRGGKNLPTGAAGADLPPAHAIMARIADLDDDHDLRRKAADLARRFRRAGG
mmetsp:Transcript_13959/g.45562  ORF Transcript_13959/g.45562 Transcript_13959/m.45562 type:complete len:318 (-) Transcript_13959:130-1083(-)